MGMSHTEKPTKAKKKLSREDLARYDRVAKIREEREAQHRADLKAKRYQQQPRRNGPVHVTPGSSQVVPTPSPSPWKKQYDEYITSRAWSNRKKKFFKTHPKRCRVCGNSWERLHVHHLSYDRMGCERDSDLMALCQTHHTQVHEYAKLNTKITLREATQAFVAANKR